MAAYGRKGFVCVDVVRLCRMPVVVVYESGALSRGKRECLWSKGVSQEE